MATNQDLHNLWCQVFRKHLRKFLSTRVTMVLEEAALLYDTLETLISSETDLGKYIEIDDVTYRFLKKKLNIVYVSRDSDDFYRYEYWIVEIDDHLIPIEIRIDVEETWLRIPPANELPQDISERIISKYDDLFEEATSLAKQYGIYNTSLLYELLKKRRLILQYSVDLPCLRIKYYGDDEWYSIHRLGKYLLKLSQSYENKRVLEVIDEDAYSRVLDRVLKLALEVYRRVKEDPIGAALEGYSITTSIHYPECIIFNKYDYGRKTSLYTVILHKNLINHLLKRVQQ